MLFPVSVRTCALREEMLTDLGLCMDKSSARIRERTAHTVDDGFSDGPAWLRGAMADPGKMARC